MMIQAPEYQISNFFEVVLNTVSEGITIINKDLRVQYQNKVITLELAFVQNRFKKY